MKIFSIFFKFALLALPLILSACSQDLQLRSLGSLKNDPYGAASKIPGAYSIVIENESKLSE